jgi:formylmethanofuran dehydrogenase subunit C
MKSIILTPKKSSKIPVEAEAIIPDSFAGKTLEEIRNLNVYVGNGVHVLDEFFKVDGESAESAMKQKIIVDGDAAHVKYIGRGMTSGEVVIKGNAGMHTGSMMSGGSLTVEGDADDWAGAEMKGGLLRIRGNAKDLLGSAYRGSSEGLTGGCIFVDGNIGSEAGSFMRRGMMVVRGNTGNYTGLQLNGGEIFVFGRLGKRAGALAKGNGGFIACFGDVEEILPTYILETTYTPTFMRLYLRELSEKLGLEEATRFMGAPLMRYRGDMAVGGTAEILIAQKG